MNSVNQKIKEQELVSKNTTPINNCLIRLDSEEYARKGSDNIRIYRIGGIIRGIYGDIRKYKKVKYIEMETKPHQTYSNWILEKVGISIQDLYSLCLYWKNVCGKSDSELDGLWDYIYTNSHYFGCVNGKIVKLPKVLDYKLAYLLGVIFGDGHLADPNRSYDKKTSYNSELRITDQYEETFIFLIKFFEELFGYTPKIYSEKSKVGKYFYRFVIHSKPIHRFLMVICGMPTGNKCEKMDIPPLITNAHLELKKWFIVGFFDADGCLRLAQKKFPEVSISQLKSKILLSIMEVSKDLGIRWSGPYKCDCQRNHSYVIKITNKENVERFLNNFISLNPIKIRQRQILWEKIRK